MNAADQGVIRGSQTLARGLAILDELRRNPTGLSVADLVRNLQLPRAIVTRLLVTLEQQRYVERTESRSYRLGLELIALGKAVRSDVRANAVMVLSGLAETLGATAVLVMRDDAHAVVISVVEPSHTDLRLSFRLGSRHLLDQGAEGMAILAGNAPVRSERAEVTAARIAGYAVSAGEIMPGTWGLAVPVITADGACALSIGVITALALDEDKVSTAVIDAARELGDLINSLDEVR